MFDVKGNFSVEKFALKSISEDRPSQAMSVIFHNYWTPVEENMLNHPER